MKSLLIKSYLIILTVPLLIPLLTLAIDPINPKSYCDRFLDDQKQNECFQKAKQNNSDWYVIYACNKLHDDKNFLKCWDFTFGNTFNPLALDLCIKNQTNENSDDSSILNCIQWVGNKSFLEKDLKDCQKISQIKEVTQCLKKVSEKRMPASESIGPFQNTVIHKNK